MHESLHLGNVIGQPQRRNPTSSTEVVGCVLSQADSVTGEEVLDGSRSNIVALCTLDGRLGLVLVIHCSIQA